MQDTQLSTISNFIWGVADDFLRDLYVRGKYRDVILLMTVLRRLDAVLEPTKQKVLDEKKWLDEAGIEDQAAVLEQAAGQAFFNTSPFGLKDLSLPGRPSSSSGTTSTPTWTGSRPTSKTSSRSSSSATRLAGSPAGTFWAASSTGSCPLRST